MTPKEYDNILYTDLNSKLEGFNERKEYELDLVRNLSFTVYRAGNPDPKKAAKTVDEFWPKDGRRKTPKLTTAKRERLAQAVRKYNENAAKVTDRVRTGGERAEPDSIGNRTPQRET